MKHRNVRFWLVPVLALVCLLAQPVAVQSQCAVTSTGMNTFGSNISVYKVLDTSVVCASVTNMNVNACFPTAPNMTTFLVASANTMVGPASCSWTCQCGASTPSFSIGPSDGLPVELMDFGFEDEEAG